MSGINTSQADFSTIVIFETVTANDAQHAPHAADIINHNRSSTSLL